MLRTVDLVDGATREEGLGNALSCELNDNGGEGGKWNDVVGKRGGRGKGRKGKGQMEVRRNNRCHAFRGRELGCP